MIRRIDGERSAFILETDNTSYIFSVLPLTGAWSEGTRTILLTIVIAGLAAVLFPKKEEQQEKEESRITDV